MESTGMHAHQQICRTHQVFSASPSPLVFAYIYIHLATWYIPLELNKGWSRVTISPDLVFQDGFDCDCFWGSCTDALRHPFLCGPKWRVESSLEMTRWSLGSFAVRIVEDFMYGADQVLFVTHLSSNPLLRPFECTLHFGLNCEHNISTH